MTQHKEIKYGTPEHSRVLNAILARYRLSREKMTTFYPTWDKAEEQFRAYIPATEADKKRNASRSQGVPQFSTIQVPYTYAILMTVITYWTTVFLARSPIHQYTARHGEPEDRVMALEALIDYQTLVGRMMVPYYIWISDAAKYGLGIIGTYWVTEEIVTTEIIEKPVTYFGIPIAGKTKKVKRSRRIPGYRGNKAYNVRPYDFFPDPRVPLIEFQKGEFCGRTLEVGWNTIIKGQDQGKYFNIAALKKLRKSIAARKEGGSTQVTLPDPDAPMVDNFDLLDMGYIRLLEMVVELQPSEWGFGSSKYPEKWVFTLANDEVLIGLQPLGNYHNQFPYSILETEIDGYSLVSRSMSETIEPLNDVMTWLINSHFYNVRKVLHDQIVVDPSRVVMRDVTDPGAGRIIRLKPDAYGTDTRTAIGQLQVSDVTQNHIRDASFIETLMQRVSGVTENIMGMVNPGGRKTATEIRTSSSFGVNRLKMHAEYMSAGGWSEHSQMLVQNTQQFYDMEQIFKVAGDTITNPKKWAEVNPESIQGFYDFIPVDGTMPIDKFAMANMWKELMAQVAKIPQLATTYDMGAIFAYTARLAGAKNIDQFKIQTSSPEQIENDLQAGNIVPIGGGNGEARGGGDPSNGNPVAGVGQVPGLGPTG